MMKASFVYDLEQIRREMQKAGDIFDEVKAKYFMMMMCSTNALGHDHRLSQCLETRKMMGWCELELY